MRTSLAELKMSTYSKDLQTGAAEPNIHYDFLRENNHFNGWMKAE